MQPSILQGIRVVDLGRYLAAPYCSQLLADMGAEVIRVERPGGEVDRQRGPYTKEGQSLLFVTLNRNKKAITLNLRSDEGYALLNKLVATSDVLLHNLPAASAASLRVRYDDFRESNPRLVYLSISGFGGKGPYASYPALDAVIQGMSGAMTISGTESTGPVLSHLPYVDFGTALYGALAIVSALFHRNTTGTGQAIDLALYSTALSFVGGYAIMADYVRNGAVRQHMGNDLIYGVGGCFPTKDGFAEINCLTGDMWTTLCGLMHQPGLLTDERFATGAGRYQHRHVINPIVQQWTTSITTAELVKTLLDAGIPSGPVQTVDQLPLDPQVQALEMFPTVDQPGAGPIPVAGSAMKFSDTPLRISRPAPAVGEHNDEIYSQVLGLTGPDIARLRRDRVI